MINIIGTCKTSCAELTHIGTNYFKSIYFNSDINYFSRPQIIKIYFIVLVMEPVARAPIV